MRVGISIFEALSPSYDLFDGREPRGTAAEVFPEATAVLLAGRLRDRSVSKRLFRSRVLSDNGVDTSTLTTADRIDAGLAALTGILALEGTYTAVGDPIEGVIMLPIGQLPSSRLLRTQTPTPVSKARATPGPEGPA
jgi:Protein of unknown function (DUF429)